jgi:hypothetical protein
MKATPKQDLETLKAGKPYLRSILAFLIYMRFGSIPDKDEGMGEKPLQGAYALADYFLNQLKKDVEHPEGDA